MSFSIVALIPNSLSIMRAFLGLLVIFSLKKGNYWIALFEIFIAGISDFFDGYVARKLNVTSKLGSLLDPIGDKIFINSAIWALYLFHIEGKLKLPVFIIALFTTLRDIALIFSSSLIIASKSNINLKPVFISKICTTVLFLFCVGLLLLPKKEKFLLYFGYICIFLILISGLSYLLRLLKYKKYK